MTPERLKEIAERAAKATPGPWVNDGADRFSDEESWVHVIDAPSLLVLAKVPCDFPNEQAHDDHLNQCGNAPNNAAFIAHARTDIPDLRAHISTLESELQQVRVERDGLREACAGLIALRTTPRVTVQQPIHTHECPCWRWGKKHGPCNCGGDELAKTVIAKAYNIASAALSLLLQQLGRRNRCERPA